MLIGSALHKGKNLTARACNSSVKCVNRMFKTTQSTAVLAIVVSIISIITAGGSITVSAKTTIKSFSD